MALDKIGLREAIIEAFSHPSTESNIEIVAQKLSEAIDEFVKSGTVIGICPPNGGALTQGKVE